MGAPAPIIETVVPAPVMAAPMVETFAPSYGMGMAAPIVETLAPSYGMGMTAAPIMAAPVVETFAPSYGVGMTTAAPLVGSISTALPMTTMAAPTMTTMAAPTTIGAPFVGTSYGLPPTIL